MKSKKGPAKLLAPIIDQQSLRIDIIIDEGDFNRLGRSPQRKWLDRFAGFFIMRFGPGWQDKDKEFWNKDMFF